MRPFSILLHHFRSSNLVVLHSRRLSAVISDIDHEVREETGRLRLEKTQRRNREATNLHLGAFAGAELEHRPPRARIPCHDDFGLRGVRKDCAGGFTRHFAPVNPVGNPSIPLHQLFNQRDVRLLRPFDLLAPLPFERLIADDRRWDDECGFGLIYIPLLELRIRETVAMTYQLVRE